MKTHFTHCSCSKQLQTSYLLQLFQKIVSQKISLNSRIQFQFFLKTFQKKSRRISLTSKIPLLSLKQSISQFKNWSQLFHSCIFLLFQFQNTPTSQKVVSQILKTIFSYIWQKLISYITFILEYFYYFIYHRCSLFKISCIIWREIYLTCWKKSASPFETIYFTILKLISIISQMHFFVI